MKEYFDMYLKIDVLLLACVSETFKTKSINSFELDLAHYLSTPCYSWNSVLRLTDINLKLISDIYWRVPIYWTHNNWGLSMVCKRYTEGNNKFLKPYDAEKLTSFMIDVNNLYGHSMM